MKTHFLKIRVPEKEHASLKAAADAEGITASEYGRNALLRDANAKREDQLLAKLEAKLNGQSSGSTPAVVDLEAKLTEVLLLVRELVSVHNAQALARVAQQIKQLYSDGKKS